MSDDIPESETRIVVSKETYDWLLEGLERPPRVNPKMVELLRKSKGRVKRAD